ncbi:carboxylating nicotinate-nucleotide diphosphorylase [Thermodesulfobacteriota bacterium]
MHAVQHLIDLALQEDIGPGDITTDNLVDRDLQGVALIIAKEALVIAGMAVAEQVFRSLDPEVRCQSEFRDGDAVQAGDVVLELAGSLQALLKGERTALNFLQHLSGIATTVRSYVEELHHKTVRLVDTRKTTPGWRVLEKYAVRVGGAHNHRTGLYDGVLIKDNHIAASGGITPAVRKVRQKVSHLVKIEVEVSNLSEVKEAVRAEADVIMLDNMDIKQIQEALKVIKGAAIVEVSGNVTRTDLNALADVGVDIISVGALTHSARSVDMSMQIK